MRPLGIYLILCGYIAGLLLARWAGFPWGCLWLGGGWLLGAIVPRFWNRSPSALTWACVGVAGFLGGIYFQLRQPLPTATDISHWVAEVPLYETVEVVGTVRERPQLTRANKARFPFAVEELRYADRLDTPQTATVSGSVYVTMPLLQATGLQAGDRATLSGRLYQPTSPTNPGQFNFRDYLIKEGIWAGLVGESIDWSTVVHRPNWLAGIRDRIVQAHVGGLGVPSGLFMSAMTLGRYGVDLPFELRDQMTALGLAHALAASGFQVALVLQGVLYIVGRSPQIRFGIGSLTLVMYSALAGFEPSVCRAAFMGGADILGQVLGRRVRSSGTLLVIATVLLLFDPLLIQNLGFQLSFLATFGLIVGAKPIARCFQGLPWKLDEAIAVPVAATLWTLPLQIYVFNVVSPIALPVNLFVGSFLGIATILSFISGIVAVVSLAGGAFLVRGFAYPLHWFLEGLGWIQTYLGRVWFVRQIDVWQMLALYGVLISFWLMGAWRSGEFTSELPDVRTANQNATPPKNLANSLANPNLANPNLANPNLGRVEFAQSGLVKPDFPDFRNVPDPLPTSRLSSAIAQTVQTVQTFRIAIALVLCVAVIGVPGYWHNRQVVEVYVLDEPSETVMLLHDRQKTVLIGQGKDANTANFTLLPVLRSLGVNHLDLAITSKQASSTSSPQQTPVSETTKAPIRSTVQPLEIIQENIEIAQHWHYETLSNQLTPDLGVQDVGEIQLKAWDQTGNLQLTIASTQTWLILNQPSPEFTINGLGNGQLTAKGSRQINVVCWSGEPLTRQFWETVRPQVAIARHAIDTATQTQLQQLGIQVWNTAEGAIVTRLDRQTGRFQLRATHSGRETNELSY